MQLYLRASVTEMLLSILFNNSYLDLSCYPLVFLNYFTKSAALILSLVYDILL